MNWLTNFVKPKLSALVRNRKEVPDNLWKNCPKCANMMHHKDLYNNLNVCISCDYHFRLPIERRIEILFEKDSFKELNLEKPQDDPLNFIDKKKYTERLKEYRKKTNRDDAFILGDSKIGKNNIVVGLMDFEFMGGSMGRAVGGAIVKAAQRSVEKNIPLILITSSGGG